MSTREKRIEEPLIQVQNLGKKFGSMEVLKDITVDIYKGDVVCVIPPSGSERVPSPLFKQTGGADIEVYPV